MFNKHCSNNIKQRSDKSYYQEGGHYQAQVFNFKVGIFFNDQFIMV